MALTLVHHGAAHVGQAGAAQRLRHVRGRYDLHLQGRAGRGEGRGGSASVAEWNGMGVKRQTGKTQALLANVSE